MKSAFLITGLILAEVMVPFSEVKAQPTTQKPLAFVAAGTNGFTFDTGVLRGQLRADGRAKGLSSVVHVPSGATISHGMGLLGHYRVFTANKRYGSGAWDWPGEAKTLPDGSVEAHWPATEDRPFELRATYRWAAPYALDVVTTVQAKTGLAKFESFLASYFSEGFTNSLVCVAEHPGRPGGAGLLAAEPSFGTWLVFPRDEAAMAVFRDGRWTIAPSPVEWVQMPRLVKPLGIRRNPTTGLSAVIMSPPGHAFAVCTPQQTESHRSLYLSLFGRDLESGETVSARARLLITDKLSEPKALEAYESYLKQLGRS